MKRPKKLFILGHTYTILSDKSPKCLKSLDNEDDPKNRLKGCFLPYEQLICIESELPEDSWYATLIHECLHGFLYHIIPTVKEIDDEMLVENLTVVIFSFLKENKLWKTK